MAKKRRLIIVANRSKYTVKKEKGKLLYHKSPGGLASALGSLSSEFETLWVGWPGISKEELSEDDVVDIAHKLNNEDCYPVFLTRKNIKNFYEGFSNKVIWPLFHYFPQYTEFNEKHWNEYLSVNKKYADAIERIYREDDILWIHDYHLMLVPGMIRERFPDATIGFFLHIPFPAYEVFRIIPWRKKLLEGLLGADLIGFHTYEYANYFMNSVLKILGFENELFYIINGRPVKVDAFPISIDYEKWAHKHKEEKVRSLADELRSAQQGRKIILSVDRLDYTKGIVSRLKAFELFLKQHPEFLEKIVYILIVVPSREDVEYYAGIKREVDELVGNINGKYSSHVWTPILFHYQSFDEDKLAGYYYSADIALVTPLRDGMNLVAKEYITTKQNSPGVLILSEMAGAAKEMNEAILINPYDIPSIAEAIYTALKMPEKEQIERNQAMQERIKTYDVNRWAWEFMDKLDTVKKEQIEKKGKKLSEKLMDKIAKDFALQKKRLLILDYDGTLIPIQKRPELAIPDKEIKRILKGLIKKDRTEVIIVSGRDRQFLEEWFGELKGISIIAEHGVWIRKKGGEWETIEPLNNSWKNELKVILEKFSLSTPGSFVEEKEYSLAWHYREADPEQGPQKAAELRSALLPYIANQDLSILEGDKVLEIKNAGVNKGAAVCKWIKENDWDFILAAGDDRTDEDVFNVLPEWAYSIKVGHKPSSARYYVESPDAIRKLLQKILKEG